jgi:hypothetical protein
LNERSSGRFKQMARGAGRGREGAGASRRPDHRNLVSDWTALAEGAPAMAEEALLIRHCVATGYGYVPDA